MPGPVGRCRDSTGNFIAAFGSDEQFPAVQDSIGLSVMTDLVGVDVASGSRILELGGKRCKFGVLGEFRLGTSPVVEGTRCAALPCPLGRCSGPRII